MSDIKVSLQIHIEGKGFETHVDITKGDAEPEELMASEMLAVYIAVSQLQQDITEQGILNGVDFAKYAESTRIKNRKVEFSKLS